ncbi:signal peptide peptidase SppA [Parvularcula sp. ZS-1/3]|uniref:Signal peptide peptidase SppA n=1 Tax=Parvularcula mediterranea TaxID=2732508 RepID=A0A7Y3RJC4_9PROT|nr:signal peptide peptidase SppA [Parvularcula mediterranea]NNU15133.1 signal peptide peptidase SppA [Parvularcula mediterranea]
MTEYVGGQERSRLTVWQFFKGLAKVVVGGALFFQALLFIALFSVLLSVFGGLNDQMAGKNEDGPNLKIPDSSALIFNPNGLLAEKAPESDPFQDAINEAFGGSSIGQVSVHQLIRVLEKAKDDERVEILVLDLGGLIIPDAYLSKAHLLADAIEDFRDSGKTVVAIGDYYSQNQYMVASEADEILLHDDGLMLFTGFGSFRTYYASLLERLEVSVNVFRVGTFKSALEPVLRDDMSPEAELANVERLEAMWGSFTARVDQNRGFEAGATAAFANAQSDAVANLGGGDAGLALVEAGFIDKLANRSQTRDFLAEYVGRDDEGELNKVMLQKYLLGLEAPTNREDVADIAVITVEGAIVDGPQEPGVASGGYVAKQLRDARKDEDVKAVVLRVDSPGGSAFASEIMRDEVLALKADGKPVVVSMSSLAASGGYWIAAPGDRIFAQPDTITGSIGIFSYLPTFEKLANKYGVFVDGVGTTPMSAISGMPLSELPEEFRRYLQLNIEDGYDDFLTVVAEGRGMTKDQVNEIAQGRVWIGAKALELGLVDELGGLDDAIASAAELAGTEDWDVVGMVKEKTRFELFLEGLAGEAEAYGLVDMDDELFASRRTGFDRTTLGQAATIVDRELRFQRSFDDPDALYARCLECAAP